MILSCGKERGKEQSPAHVKAPPQKSGIRGDAGLCIKPQGIEERGEEEKEELSCVPSAVSEAQWTQHKGENKKCN